MDESARRTRRKQRWRSVGGFVLVAILTPFLLDYFGLTDLRFPWTKPTSPDATGAPLSQDSPVIVDWTGKGDGIQIAWKPIDDPELHNYQVLVHALAPIEDWYDVGYRVGDELLTTATTNPISELNEGLADQGRAARADNDQTWRVCVTGMRDAPGGVDVAPYLIERSTRCSDVFTVPTTS